MSRTTVLGGREMTENDTWWMKCVFVPPSQGYCLTPKIQLFAVAVLRYTMLAISILVTAVTAYVVIRSKSVSREYSTMLLISLVVWMLVDAIVQWLGDPFLLFPTMCVYHRADFTHVQLTAIAGIAIVQSLVMFGVVTYFALFIYRHQKIAPAGSTFNFSLTVRIVFLFVLLFPYLGIGPLFYSECAPIAKTLYHTAHHTFAQIRDATTLSPSMLRLHRILTKSLIFQALTPLFFIIIPICMTTITQYIFTRPHDEPSINPVLPFIIALVVFSCHATAHSAVLIGTTPAFRDRLIQMVSCVLPNRIAPQHHQFAGQTAYLSFTGATTAAQEQ